LNNNPNLIDTLKKSIKDEKEVRTSEFIIAIVVNIIFIYIFNNLLNWHLNFITNSFQDVLWIINLTLGFTIIVNVLYLVYHPKWLRDFLQIIINILGFLVVYSLYTIYPFKFSQIFISYGVKLVLILIMLAIIAATAYQIMQLILRIHIKLQK
jgi:hypothetical protein